MADFYEMDFLPVHRSDSGDAIAMRYQIGSEWCVHVVDGGFTGTAEGLKQCIRKYYGTDFINRVIVTHPDQDHAEGLAPILEDFRVGELWMLCPWHYANELLPHFARVASADNLVTRLRQDYPYIAALEDIAKRKGIPIYSPFQGARIGPFTVFAPSRWRYGQLILDFEKTPQRSIWSRNLLNELAKAAKPLVNLIRAGWGAEKFSIEETSVENEMSVVQYANLCGHKILLTGDAGRDAMNEAASYAPFAGLTLPGIDRFQAPHHGGRRNVDTAILDRWLGQRLLGILPEGKELFTAMISAATEDLDHPRNAVLRGLIHRGARVLTTEDGHFRIWKNLPDRQGWVPKPRAAYPEQQEA